VQKKRRTYNPRLIRRDYSYTIQEIAALFGLHKNAVSRWFKDGLRSIDGVRPLLVHGSDLMTFLDERKRRRRVTCKREEIYCFRCRAPRRPLGMKVDVLPRNPKIITIVALCETCEGPMRKSASVRDGQLYRQLFITSTPAALHLNETPEPSVKCDLKGEAQDV
jgi:hypothetical protein